MDDSIFEWDKYTNSAGEVTDDEPGLDSTYRPGYNWDADHLNFHRKLYYGDVLEGAKSYWVEEMKHGLNPWPYEAIYNGRKKLGRPVGPYECQYWLRMAVWNSKRIWINFFASLIILAWAAFQTGFGLIGIILCILPIGWFVSRKIFLRRLYTFWLITQGRAIREGPVWVPYNRQQLRKIREKGIDYAWP